MNKERTVPVMVYLPRKIVKKLEKNRDDKGIQISTQLRAIVMEKLNG